MTVGDFLRSTTAELTRVGIATARLDSLVLLENALNTNRTHILANPDASLGNAQLRVLKKHLSRRLQHEPIAYILSRSEFYGRNFYIDHRVLEPRPESEAIIELAHQLMPSPQLIIDVGTGSGALAITTALEFANTEVIATDIDSGCLSVTRKNCKNFEVDVHLYQGDLIKPFLNLEKLGGAALLCNLPYVPDSFHINPAAMHEPKLAIFGGSDGLDTYRRLFLQITETQYMPKWVLTESLPPQHDELARIAHQAGFELQKTLDFAQLFKMSVVPETTVS